MLWLVGVTDILAIYGAILASVGLGWNLYRDLLDRARLKVKANVRRIVQSADGKWYSVRPDLPVVGASDQLFIVMNVTNVGRRPIQWIGWGGEYHKPVNGKKSFVIIPIELPRTLGESDWHTEHTAELNPADENLKRLFIWDSSGKNWRLSRWQMNKLKREFTKFRGSTSP
ncbi:MAG: hypothetical protein HY316_01705 [Acidobacteria bacterium]|nr:hypothetical protein [Acidobacteriota bacterium]